VSRLVFRLSLGCRDLVGNYGGLTFDIAVWRVFSQQRTGRVEEYGRSSESGWVQVGRLGYAFFF